ncbi:hypothetical protein [Mesobacillus zeae]|uniref:FlgD Ig-like domain-containing protein n=1 Tax=Mesobacillus zeae TaxID=1917180 RepID=A0A398B3Z2_9BACI|nr:hypothetical protein [Mesobacillus zeae]RID82496.1 hypothetical protein D1970_19015 [Mesobacillus zeae]
MTNEVSASKPAEINAFANNRVNWSIHIKDAAGNVMDTLKAENEHEIHMKWAPKVELPSGSYIISAEVVNKQGFKVTTSPKTITVVEEYRIAERTMNSLFMVLSREMMPLFLVLFITPSSSQTKIHP